MAEVVAGTLAYVDSTARSSVSVATARPPAARREPIGRASL